MFTLVQEIMVNYKINNIPDDILQRISYAHNIPEILTRVIINRGIEEENIPSYLNPTLRDLMPDPFLFKDMDRAVERVANALKSEDKICIFGDYDVDGATSTAQLIRFFNACGVEVDFYIPDRIAEGYGPSVEAFKEIKARGANLIITVDCGTVSNEPIKWAKENNVDVIVLDHHIGAEKLPPEAVAIVNPNRLDESEEAQKYNNLAAAGVTFIFLVALRGKLDNAPPKEFLMSLLGLAALGTVCDVMSLKGFNRAIVASGLKVIAKRGIKGINAIVDHQNLKQQVQAFHFGFVIGPRINACGRLADSTLGTKLLTTEKEGEALKLAEQLDKLNSQRKDIELGILENATALAEEKSNQPLIFVSGDDWHEGVIGIVASRLKDKFNKPAVVMSEYNGMVKGSIRSTPALDVGAMIASAKMEGIIEKGGGHKAAGGFSVEFDKKDNLEQYFYKYAAQFMDSNYVEEVIIDAEITPDAATKELAEKLTLLEPYGIGNKKPVFKLSGFKIDYYDIKKDKHLLMTLSSKTGGGKVKATYFNMDTKKAERLKEQTTTSSSGASLIGNVDLNEWNGNVSVQFNVKDIMFSESG